LLAFEQAKASVRAFVEHPFHIIKNLFRHRKIRYRGLAPKSSSTSSPLRTEQPRRRRENNELRFGDKPPGGALKPQPMTESCQFRPHWDATIGSQGRD
jgi:hypothetical protein